MKSILVPLKTEAPVEPVLGLVLLVAQAFTARISIYPVSRVPITVTSADAVGATVLYDVDFAGDEAANATLRRAVEAFMSEHGVEQGPRRADAPTWEWIGGEPSPDLGVIGRLGRAFDLTVVGRPGGGESLESSVLESALFDSGRPVLIAPPGPAPSIGQMAVIAWNGSSETARTISFALPFLRRARRVLVLTVEGSGVPGPTGSDIARSLAPHGIAAEAVTIERGSATPGEAILAEAGRLGCDLLVKGAYTQSKLRQMIFGGATRHIIAETTIPVLMAH